MSSSLRVFHQIQIAHSALFRAADQRTQSDVGLSTTQLAVLFVLKRQDGAPISEIAKTLAMGKSSLTGLIDRMCDRALVRRAASAEDGRVTHVFLEPQGQALLQSGSAAVNAFNAALLAPFDAAEQEVIDRFLTHISQNANQIICGPPDDQKEPDDRP